MRKEQVQAAQDWLRKVRRGYRQLPKAAQVAVWAIAAAGPVFALGAGLSSGGGQGNDSTAGDTAATWGAESSGGDERSAGGGSAAGDSSFAGNGTFLRGAAGVESTNLAYEIEKIGRAGAFGVAADDEKLDLDEALEVLTKRVREASEDADVLKAIRNSEHGDEPAQLLAHSLPLMASGDVWGAAANLLIAHERKEDDATPLVNLAAIANSQGLPAVALALLEAAGELRITDDDSPAGIRERASWLNNRGHALILLGRYDDAPEPARDQSEHRRHDADRARVRRSDARVLP